MQCTNHLKQIGLAAHNFNDTQSGLPPSHIGPYAYVTFWFIILPYLEQNAAYEALASKPNGLGTNLEPNVGLSDISNAAAVSGNMPGDTHAERIAYLKSLARINFYYCPTRRSASDELATATSNNNPNPGGNTCGSAPPAVSAHPFGPPSDYAIVCIAMVNDDDGSGMNWWDQLHRTSDDGNAANVAARLAREYSPFRAATHSGTWEKVDAVMSTWKPRDSIARWQDGASNQIIAGEKYMHTDDLYHTKHDSTWLWGHAHTWSGTVRGFNDWWPLARSGVKECYDQSNNSHKRFGSWHPGICNFVFGDGSVRGVSCMTSTKNILEPLAKVDDGVAVSIP